MNDMNKGYSLTLTLSVLDSRDMSSTGCAKTWLFEYTETLLSPVLIHRALKVIGEIRIRRTPRLAPTRRIPSQEIQGSGSTSKLRPERTPGVPV